MVLTRDEVLHLAKLCRIDLQPEEVEKFALQLSSILEYVGKLREVDVDVAQEAVANITGLENVLREDEPHGCTPEERERIVAQFPMRQGDLLKTRGVFSE
ncbi:Asp-tRNA(Asn)/Glu-tRNA(Gln) amidotransferase subunit GatC [Candidatus Uhrbacteria bacterium]|nr:Asp-tRNA(Asn)/Glu-tRNA(Gln) amidotransferase subunit GatC [Candidatus Uhrbacteria bacterium]